MSNVLELHDNEEKRFKLKVEMAIGMTVDNAIDKGLVAGIDRKELEQYLYSKVQGFARQFLKNISYSVPYYPSGESDIDQKSEALATMTSESIGQMTMVLLAQTLTKVVELEIQLWLKSRELSDLANRTRS